MKQPHQNPLFTTPIELGGITIRPLDLFEHVLATGGTGSGKTRSFLLPLVEQVLKRFGKEPAQKAGMILIDAKGDMSELAAECIRRAGRREDLHILGENGNCWFSLFEQFDGDATAVTDFLFEMLEDRTGTGATGENDSFWEENSRRLLRAGTICAKAQHGLELGGLKGIADGVNLVMTVRKQGIEDFDDCDETNAETNAVEELANNAFFAGRISHQELNQLVEYITHDVPTGSPKTWGVIANMTRNYIAQFSQPDLLEIFQEQPGKRRLIPEDLIDEGLLLIVSLSPVVYRAAADPFRIAVKKAFCERILQRNHLVISEGDRERSINQTRPILYVMDEFHTTLSPKGRSSDAYFLDRAREFRCMCVLATQGISAISSVLPTYGMCDHLLNNCRTKFFFANDCPQTSRYFEEIGGVEDRKVTSIHYQRVAPPPRFRLPNHDFVAPKQTMSAGYAVDTRKQPRFSSAELGGLPNGTALVVTKGRKLFRYKMDPKSYAGGRKEIQP